MLLGGNGQDRDLRLRISCRLRIPPALAAVATSQLVATTDAEYHGRSRIYSLALLLFKNRSRSKKDKKIKLKFVTGWQCLLRVDAWLRLDDAHIQAKTGINNFIARNEGFELNNTYIPL